MNQTNDKVLSYFPGCSLSGTNKAYDLSARAVAQTLGVEMIELDDWNCCGATAYMAINEKRSFGRKVTLNDVSEDQPCNSSCWAPTSNLKLTFLALSLDQPSSIIQRSLMWNEPLPSLFLSSQRSGK